MIALKIGNFFIMGVCLLTFTTVNCLSLTNQTIQISRQIQNISIDLICGSNTVEELFPNAPLGTMIFKYDNATGFSGTEMFQLGWSHPNLELKAGTGAIFILPAIESQHEIIVKSVSFPPPTTNILSYDIEGEVPASPPALYRGWNLIPGDNLQRFKSGDPEAFPNPELVCRTYGIGGSFGILFYYYFPASDSWLHEVRYQNGEALWCRSELWPPNPSGTFNSNLSDIFPQTKFEDHVIFFNRFASIYPLVLPNGCAPTNATAQLFFRSGEVIEPVGAPVKIMTGEINGFLDPSVDLIRYLPRTQGNANDIGFLFVEVETEEGTFKSAEVSRPAVPLFPFSFNMYPFNLEKPNNFPVFFQNPILTNPPFKSAVTLNYTYAYYTFPNPSTSVTNIRTCPECSLFFQWQKKVGPEQWIDVVGATNDLLTIESLRESDYGTYRLQAHWGECVYDYSQEAVVGPGQLWLTINKSPLQNYLNLTVFSSLKRPSRLELSRNLRDWSPVSTNTAQQWNVHLPITESAFFRAEMIE